MTAALLERLRAFALALPEAVESNAFGHPNFKAGKKTFCVYESYEGRASLALKPPRVEGERRLADPRFFRTPYLGKQGGGLGFHGNVRLYPERGIGTVLLINSTEASAAPIDRRSDALDSLVLGG